MQGKIVDKFQLKDGKEIIFRYPNEGDAPLMLDYINTLSKEKTFIRFQGKQLTLDEEQKYLDKVLEQIEKNLAVKILAFCYGKLVGVSDLTMLEEASKHVGNFGITIAKEYRNLGIGKKLMKTVLDKSRNLSGLKIIILGVFSDNQIALNLYKSFGFEEFGTLPDGIMHQDHFDNHISMFKKV